MIQAAISDNAQKNRHHHMCWWIIIGGVLFQLMIFIGMVLIRRPDTADIVLTKVADNPPLCRVVSIAPFSDARLLYGLTPGMLVRPVLAPPSRFEIPPGGPVGEPGKIEGCQIVSGLAMFSIVGREQEPPVPVFRSVPSPDPVNTILGTILAIIFQFAGALILLRAQNRPTARIAYALFYVFSLICLIFNNGDPQRSWETLFFFVLTTLTGGLSTTFVCLFPSPRQKTIPRLARWRCFSRWLPYLPLAAALLLVAVGTIVFVFHLSYRFLILPLSAGYGLLCLLVVVATLVWGLRHLDQYERQFARIIIASMAFLLFPMVLYLGSFQAGHHVHDSILRLIPLPLLVLPIICDYALFRYHLIGTTSLTNRRVMRVLLWILLACLFILPIILLQRSLENSTALPEVVRDYLYAGLLALSLWLFPLAWNKVRNVGDHVFYRDFYEYNRSLSELSTALTQLQGLDQISAFILPRLAQLLNTSDALLFVRAISQDELNYQGDAYKESAHSWHLYRHAPSSERCSEAWLRQLVGSVLLQIPRQRKPLVLEGILFLALYQGEHISGFLCLGPKNNREAYSRQDLSFLTTLAAQLSVLEVNNRYLMQARLDAQKVTALNRRVISAQEDERRNLALDLHDDVLQQALLLVRQLSDAGTMSEVADAMPLARAVVRNVRCTCLALRPSLLDELGLAEALRWLAQQNAQLGGGKIQIEVVLANPSSQQPRVAAPIELAFYRVAQEALTNVLKHARASTVILRLRDVSRRYEGQVYRSLSLVIVDNGCGMPEKRSSAQNLGLIGMHERMAAIDGRIQFRTCPGRGFVVRAIYSDSIDSSEKLEALN